MKDASNLDLYDLQSDFLALRIYYANNQKEENIVSPSHANPDLGGVIAHQ